MHESDFWVACNLCDMCMVLCLLHHMRALLRLKPISALIVVCEYCVCIFHQFFPYICCIYQHKMLISVYK